MKINILFLGMFIFCYSCASTKEECLDSEKYNNTSCSLSLLIDKKDSIFHYKEYFSPVFSFSLTNTGKSSLTIPNEFLSGAKRDCSSELYFDLERFDYQKNKYVEYHNDQIIEYDYVYTENEKYVKLDCKMKHKFTSEILFNHPITKIGKYRLKAHLRLKNLCGNEIVSQWHYFNVIK